MRLLIINPNTSVGVTEHIARAASSAAQPEDTLTVISAPFGVPLIIDENDVRTAVEAVIAAINAHSYQVDGIIIASFGDTGIEQVRNRVDCPVIGIAHAALLIARAVGERFSIVSFDPALIPSLRGIVKRYGMANRLASLRVVENTSWDEIDTIQDGLHDELTSLCELSCADGGNSIILGGGPLAGMARRLVSPHITLPLIDGTTAAVHLMRGVLSGCHLSQ